jgi:Na+-driven multidrug efflux pump
MENNIKKLANAYFSIMILVAAMGLIALCLGVGTYISGLVEKPENTIQISNLLAMIIFYPLSFSGAALVCAYLSRPRGEEKQEYKFFDALKALFRITKNAQMRGDEQLPKRFLSAPLCLCLLILALMSYLCFYIFVATVMIKIYNALWQLIIVILIIALIIAFRYSVIRMKLMRIKNKKA